MALGSSGAYPDNQNRTNPLESNPMKLKRNLIAVTLALGLGGLGTQTTQASVYHDSGRGPRLATANKSDTLSTLEDFKNLQKGDQLAAYCPMMKKTIVTTVRNVDGRGRVILKETKEGLKMDGCNIVLQRKSGSKEVHSKMVCPDGTLSPVQCSKL